MKKTIVATLALLGTVSIASAADLPVKAAPIAPTPMTDWSGFYVGVHGGWGWNGQNDFETGGELVGSNNLSGNNNTFSNALSGGLAGGQVGYNWQMNRWVFGVQGDASWADIKASAGNPLNLRDGRCSFAGTPDQTAECRTTIKAMGNLTARGGYLVTPSTLLYGKAGINWSSIDYQVLNDVAFSGTCGIPGVGTRYPGYNTVSKVRTGATAGVGIEQRIWNNVTVFGKYDVMENGRSVNNLFTGGTGVAGCTPNFVMKTTTAATQVVKFGLNYQFNGGPIVAKY
jgi:outer membrane immunogenic protein